MYNQVAPWDDPIKYKKTRKKKYTITASMPPMGTQVHNKLEKANYVTNENKKFVLTGTVGEQWVIDAGKLAKTYTFEDGTQITPDALKRKLVKGIKNGQEFPCLKPFRVTTQPGVPNWAVHVPKQYVFQIPTSWGDVLTVNDPSLPHGSGDFIVCVDAGGFPNLNDRWVVNGLIFPDTYDMRAFPNMATISMNNNGGSHPHPEFDGVTFGSINTPEKELARDLDRIRQGKPVAANSNMNSLIAGFKKSSADMYKTVNAKVGGKFRNPTWSDTPAEDKGMENWVKSFEFDIDGPYDDNYMAVLAFNKQGSKPTLALTVILESDLVLEEYDLPMSLDGIKKAYALIIKECRAKGMPGF